MKGIQCQFIRYETLHNWRTVLLSRFKISLHGLLWQKVGTGALYLQKLYPLLRRWSEIKTLSVRELHDFASCTVYRDNLAVWDFKGDWLVFCGEIACLIFLAHLPKPFSVDKLWLLVMVNRIPWSEAMIQIEKNGLCVWNKISLNILLPTIDADVDWNVTRNYEKEQSQFVIFMFSKELGRGR
jgi:hypothetical protein